MGIWGSSAGCKDTSGRRQGLVLENGCDMENRTFRSAGSVVFGRNGRERTGREKLYGIFELHDVLYGPRGTKFPHDGSHPVEYPDGTG